ncbi:MAG: GNAT family N-acetyltransferase [Trueperaceae bacterium]|nr:GNAT family N-acetyltransferase [Trueperaceae bacterium]
MSDEPRPTHPVPDVDGEQLRAAVRRHYAARLKQGTCCGTDTPTSDMFGVPLGLDAPPDVPTFGCGDPNAAASLREGETVLDLGSGAGFDAFRAAEAVGPSGEVLGVDMTPAMLARARDGAARLGYSQVRFLEGTIERLPLSDESVDVVISNCVVNLSSDVPRVLDEAARVLRPGGRLRISDTFRAGSVRAMPDHETWCTCEAGAHDPDQLATLARAAGFVDVSVDAPPAGTEEGALYGAVLHGTKPTIAPLRDVDAEVAARLLAASGLPLAGWSAPNVDRWGAFDGRADVDDGAEGGRLVGLVALETHGRHGLLRSLTVVPEARGRGLATSLVARARREARRRNLETLTGLTETIPDLLVQWGFHEVTRADLPDALRASPELQDACPQSARVFTVDALARDETPLER